MNMEYIYIMTMKLKLTILIILILFSPSISAQENGELTVNYQPIISQSQTTTSEVKTTGIITPAVDDTVIVFVESGLWGNADIKAAVIQYVTDLNHSGYSPFLHTSSVASAGALRSLLISYYSIYAITGAVLIGDMPYAEFWHDDSVAGFAAESFICDLYLMDLDGTWQDLLAGDGIFDSHSDGSGDIEPEIFVGRIDASSRILGSQSNAEDIIDLLSRAHSYRYGGVARNHDAIMYIDDDWASQYSWPDWVDSIYPGKTTVNLPTTYTNATDWLDRMTQNYEFGHLCAHSSATTHYFGDGGWGEGTLHVSEIHDARPSFNFYNLFNCHGSDYSVNDCLAVTYLYSSDYSLAVVSSAKTGGILEAQNFYYPLSQDGSIGDGFHNWFQGMTSYAGSSYIQWFYGMNILGDPFLRPNAEFNHLTPMISSTTHPSSSTWYSGVDLQLNWTEPINGNGIEGYYYLLNKQPKTLPTNITGTYTTLTGMDITLVDDGIWYLHLIVKDGTGSVGQVASHFKIKIDYSAPSVIITLPLENAVFKPEEFTFSWEASDSSSGLYVSEIYFDGSLVDIVSNVTTSSTAIFYTNGFHTINVTTFDNAGFSGSDQITIEIYAFVQTTTFKIILGLGIPIVVLAIVGGIFFGVRKKKLAP
ncbi:MAG: hypothetical protein ACTSO7_09300 [Candidatus Heimdallarchaeota archaeon]